MIGWEDKLSFDDYLANYTSGGVTMKEGIATFLRLDKGQVEGYRESQEIPLKTDTTIIGRPPVLSDTDTEIPDVIINDDYVSRGHIRIYYSSDEGQFMVQERDAGTVNGTFINGEQVESGKPYPLKDGDLLGLAMVDGDCRVVFRFRERESTLPGLSAPKTTPARGFFIDLQARRAWSKGKEVRLRKKEFDLLAFLYENKNRACSRDDIAQTVWAEESGIVSEETIDTTIHRLRERIEPDPSKPSLIITLPRYGFRLDL